MVVVTGGTGFIGSYLVRKLINSGEDVKVIDINKPGPMLLDIGKNFGFIRADITDEKAMLEHVKGDVVFHLGAMVGRLAGEENRVETLRVNINGTLNVLEACRKNDVGRMIFSSTSEVLGEAIYTPMDEKHPKNPITTYGIAKEAAEDLCKQYNRWYGLNVVCPRFFNVYGPGEKPNVYRGVITRFIWGVLNNRRPVVDKGCKRTFQYVTDLVEALASLMEKGRAGEVYHLCSEVPVGIEELASMIIRLCGSGVKPKFREPGPMDVRIKIPSGEKARKEIGYSPKVGLEDGIKRTIEWQRSLLEEKD